MNAAAPITAKARVGELDILRGFALLGVMMINVWELGGEGVTVTAAQLAALPNAALNGTIEFWMRLLVSDKANTLFACLFGMGFWIQMERLEARGAPFRSIYFRRAMILLIFGWLHLYLLFSWVHPAVQPQSVRARHARSGSGAASVRQASYNLALRLVGHFGSARCGHLG